MPHGMHPIPATAMSAVEGLLAIGPDSFLAGFHPLPLLLSRYPEHTALSRRRSWVRIPHALPLSLLFALTP